VAAPFLVLEQPNTGSDALMAFSSSGGLLWRHDFNQTFQFASNGYGPPWEFGASLATHDGLDSYIWSAADSHFWSPSSLVKLDRNGRSLGNFVNWGHIHVLSQFRSAGRSFILAGGINNECDCAMLAVLREDEPSGSSPGLPPANGTVEFQCDNCPPGRPFRYFLFPKSEVNIATGTTYNQVLVIQPGYGGIRVGVRETNAGDESGIGADWEMYTLSADFVPQSFEVSDHLKLLHQQLEAAGKIRHKLAHCPELHNPRPVHVWSSEDGWREVAVRPI
jgi:hypothetical protein